MVIRDARRPRVPLLVRKTERNQASEDRARACGREKKWGDRESEPRRKQSTVVDDNEISQNIEGASWLGTIAFLDYVIANKTPRVSDKSVIGNLKDPGNITLDTLLDLLYDTRYMLLYLIKYFFSYTFIMEKIGWFIGFIGSSSKIMHISRNK